MASLGDVLEACKSLSGDKIVELKRRMDELDASRHPEAYAAPVALSEEEAFRQAQRDMAKRLSKDERMQHGMGGGARAKKETPEQEAQRKGRARQQEIERRKKEAEQSRLEAGETNTISRAEQLEQIAQSRRKVKSGIRQAKTGSAKHKFDLEAHEARKNGELYKTGSAWHSERNSAKANGKLKKKADTAKGKKKK